MKPVDDAQLIEFADMRVDDVMVPRADIVAIEDGATIRVLLDSFIEANHSRLPIYHETLDDISGFIHIKDLLRWMTQRSSQRSAPARPRRWRRPSRRSRDSRSPRRDLSVTVKQASIARNLLFVPPSMPAPDLLVKMQASHIHLAIVVDEYGGTDGLVSIEDLVEEIVGDISDEHDTDDEQLIRGGEDGVYVADGRVGIEELEKLLEASTSCPKNARKTPTRWAASSSPWPAAFRCAANSSAIPAASNSRSSIPIRAA